MGYTALLQFDQKRDYTQRFLCIAISDGKKTASGLTVRWNNTSQGHPMRL